MFQGIPWLTCPDRTSGSLGASRVQQQASIFPVNPPSLVTPHSRDAQVVTAWNGMTISAFANASRVLAAEQPLARFPIDGRPAADYLDAAEKARCCISLSWTLTVFAPAKCSFLIDGRPARDYLNAAKQVIHQG